MWSTQHSSRTQFFLEREIFQTKVVDKIKTHILCSVIFFFENRVIYEIMWKNIVESDRIQITIWRMRVMCWITRNKYILRICNTYCFSTATMAARKRPNVTYKRALPRLSFVLILTTSTSRRRRHY